MSTKEVRCFNCENFVLKTTAENPYRPGHCTYWGVPKKAFDSCSEFEPRESTLPDHVSDDPSRNFDILKSDEEK